MMTEFPSSYEMTLGIYGLNDIHPIYLPLQLVAKAFYVQDFSLGKRIFRALECNRTLF
jgi:hypothetical protein